jgi:predicted ATP-dependent endonuclease of OLD family
VKIKSIHIKNLRAIKEQLVELDDYTCFVGPNGAGKSTVMHALNVFFRESQGGNGVIDSNVLTKDDFHQRDTSKPIEITVTFTELSEDAKTDFADYFRNNQLVISAVATFDENKERAEVKQCGKRMVMSQFKGYFKALNDGAKVADLQHIFGNICIEFPELLGARTKDAMSTALREYETAHSDLCELISSEDQFYGVSKGSNRLAKYIQWVYVPAVKDALEEQTETRNTALGKLLARAVRSKVNFSEDIAVIQKEAQDRYRCLLEKNQTALDEVSSSLRKRISEWAHPEATIKVQWQQDPLKSVKIEEPFAGILAGEGDFEGQLSHFGNGLQRSFLLALLQELANFNSDGPLLLLGIEEPELYQHPPQEKHLASVLQNLSENNAQIIITTHSPHFISGIGFENVRMVRRHTTEKYTTIKQLKFEKIADEIATASGEKPVRPKGIAAKLNQILQPSLNEMFFTQRLILVEGLEDLAYISSWLLISGRWDEYRRLGCHIVPCNGKSYLIQPLVIAKGLDIPVILIFDADKGAENPDAHKKENCTLLHLIGGDPTRPFPDAAVWGNNYVVWSTNIGETLSSEVGSVGWEKAKESACRECGQIAGAKKNSRYIGACLDYLWKNKIKPPSLERLCKMIVE